MSAAWSEVYHLSPKRFITFRTFPRDSVTLRRGRHALKLKSLNHHSPSSFTMVRHAIYLSNVANIRLFIAWQERQKGKEE